MAQPSTTRNFFGRVVDRILPGSNYNTQTGQYSNIGAGVAGLGARMAATAFLGPAAGALVGKGADMLINRNDNRIGGVVPEGIPATTNMSIGNQPIAVNAGMAPTMSLGLGGWNGSLATMGNNSFGGNVGRYSQWSPVSAWGSSVTAQPAPAGSALGFGNNVGNMITPQQTQQYRPASASLGRTNSNWSQVDPSDLGYDDMSSLYAIKPAANQRHKAMN